MNPPRPLTDEEAADFALWMSPFEREVIALCAKGKALGYARIAEKIGAPYAEVQSVGRKLQAKRLAYISVVRQADEYHGSALFLNDRGERVKRAVEILARFRINREG